MILLSYIYTKTSLLLYTLYYQYYSIETMSVLVVFVSGFFAYPALSKLYEYYQQRNKRQQLAANPLLNQIAYSNQNTNPNSDWEQCDIDTCHKSRQSNPQNLEPTINLELDTEYTMNIAVCGNSGTGKY